MTAVLIYDVHCYIQNSKDAWGVSAVRSVGAHKRVAVSVVVFLLKFSMIFYTFSTSKVHHCIKARTAHFKLLLFSFFILCVLIWETM